MAVNDELDRCLNHERMTREDWQSLTKVLDVELPAPGDRRQTINQELRHSYGHTVANLGREWSEPDYEVIVRACAKKLNITVRKHNSVTELEDRILADLVDRARERIIKEKGQQAWTSIETQAQKEIERRIEAGGVPPETAAQLRGVGGVGMLGALIAGRLAGFGLYMVANQAFFAIAKFLGWRIGVAVAGPIIGTGLAFLLGPAGFLIAGAYLAASLGDTNWKKVIPAVAIVAMLRRRFEFETT